MRCLFIINPHSRNGRTEQAVAELRAEIACHGLAGELAFCKGMAHAAQLSAEAQGSCDAIVAVGGDGTINRVLNGFYFPDGHRRSETRFGAVHIGTSPDFCRSYGIPTDLKGAVTALAAAQTRYIRPGRIRYWVGQQPVTSLFGCCANVGIGASLARLANGGIRKHMGDFLGTLMCLLRVLATYKPRAVSMRLDGRDVAREEVCNVAIGKSRYIASGLQVRHDLGATDDRFYVLAVRKPTATQLGPMLKRLYSGAIDRPDPCLSLEYARNITFSHRASELEVEFDGDAAGTCPCEVDAAADPLEIFVDPGL